MTTSSVTGLSPFIVLATLAQDNAQTAQQTQLAEISQDLQNQLNRKLATLQTPTDQVSVNYSQAQIGRLQAQQSTVSGLETQFGNNGSLLSDMTSQLNLMAQAVTSSNSSGFDNALSAVNTDLTDLAVVAYNPLFQADGIAALKTSGIAIQSSASYNLSLPAGQTAATAAVTAVQNLIQGILTINGANQIVAASQLTALDGQINSLQTLQTQQQSAQSQANAQETQLLTQNMQNQLHLIELNLGNTSQLSTMLTQFSNPPAQITSVFGALENAVGATASSAETQLGQTPAIMSLFA
ncbi:MAG TPA: hypothetical protein VNF99_17655 [Stellaceae bacterium]|nr:hypothetical protein [Stellaceae bacterium]